MRTRLRGAPSASGPTVRVFGDSPTRVRRCRGTRRSPNGAYRDLWAAEAAVRSPALRFLVPNQTLELAPSDAQRFGVAQGDEVEVRSNGTSVRARVRIHERMREGAGFMIDGLAENSANALAGEAAVEVTKVEEAAE